MKASVVTVRPPPSYAPSGPHYFEAKTDNDILIVFSRPADGAISLSDALDIDLENVDADQRVNNLTTGQIVSLRIDRNNIHDLLLPMKHGGSRFPTAGRRAGGLNPS